MIATKGVPIFFPSDISNQAWICAHRADDEMMPYGSKMRP
jgi:hypothetical protein